MAKSRQSSIYLAHIRFPSSNHDSDSTTYSQRTLFFKEDVHFSKSQFQKLQFAEVMCSSLAAIGFVCSTMVYERTYSESLYTSYEPQVTLLTVLSSFSTLALLLCVAWRVFKELAWEQAKGVYSGQDSLCTTGKLK